MARLAEEQLQDFYEQCYTPGVDGDKYRRWRELGAEGKADHVMALVARAGLPAPDSVCEVGCGDGAVLGVLGRRGFGTRRVGYEISASGVKLAAERTEVTEAHVFDGARLPVGDDAYDLVFATHVLEHVPDPAPLTRELLRAGRAAVIEVPLEANLSARRPAARAASEGVGHLHRFHRRAIRRLVADAGGRVAAELVDPLPREVHLFGADDAAARAKGYAKWALRAGAAAVPALGERLFTLHFAILALPAR
ncbi:MAG TPA: class I SAM-dependent methyltransferase [Baekduia sp.]|nr:class I SAM-dependent methyltransferase [Baekduia sp.]